MTPKGRSTLARTLDLVLFFARFIDAFFVAIATVGEAFRLRGGGDHCVDDLGLAVHADMRL